MLVITREAVNSLFNECTHEHRVEVMDTWASYTQHEAVFAMENTVWELHCKYNNIQERSLYDYMELYSEDIEATYKLACVICMINA
jgi:proteasome lid subunit RPN8/RPN11